MTFTWLLKPGCIRLIITLLMALQMSACSTEDFVESLADNITSDTASISITETPATTSTAITITETTAVAMVSYNADLSDARPLSGAALKQTMVYMFFSNASQYSEIVFYCCKGINGTSIGESHNASVRGLSTLAIDLSQYSTAGTRELYVDAIRTDGNGYDSITTYFSINITTIAVNSEPADNTKPVSEPTPVTEPEPTVGTETAPKTDPTVDTATAPKTDPTVDTETAPKTDPTVDTETAAKTDPTVDTETAPKTDPTVDTETAPKTDPTVDTETAPKTDPTVDTETAPKTDPTPTEPIVKNYSDVNLSWTAPFSREDNEPISLSDIAGYKIYYGTNKDNFNNSVSVNDGTAEDYTFKDFSSGTYYFVVTTLDTDGRESKYSTVFEISI